MAVLKDRNHQIPGGFQFYVPETKWRPQAWASFDTIVRALIAHRQGNPHLTAQKHWATDYATVANEVDSFNAQVCVQNGWHDYVVAGVSSPKTRAPRNGLAQSARNVAGGLKTLHEWNFIREGKAVPQEQATNRAQVCAQKCPMNDRGNIRDMFTILASQAIEAAIQLKNEHKLSTPFDQELGVCAACDCPLQLMVHCPLDIKLQHMPKAAHEALWENCWVRQEEAKK